MKALQSQIGTRPAAAVSREQPLEACWHALRQLSNEQLAQQVRNLAARNQALEAAMLLRLSELDRRKLYREYACSSLFGYLVTRLGFSEDAAYKRVGVARMMRDYPMVFELLSEGRIHLASLILVRPHLTQDNHREWLLAACGRSKRDVEKLVAARCPRPDVASQVRKLPTVERAVGEDAAIHASGATVGNGDARTVVGAGAMVIDGAVTAVGGADVTAVGGADVTAVGGADVTAVGGPDVTAGNRVAIESVVAPWTETSTMGVRPSSRVRIEPLSQQSYRVVFTASEQFKQKLDRASALLSHSIPPADLPALLERALDLLIDRVERRRFGSKPAGDIASRSIDGAEGVRVNGADNIEIVAENGCGDGGDDVGGDGVDDVGGDGEDDVGGAVESGGGDGEDDGCGAVENGDGVGDSRETLGDLSLGQRDAGTSQRSRSRYVPVAVVRDVWARDEGRCTYVDRDGNRCDERHFLQLDHREAHGLGGPSTLGNLRLRCAAHNALWAEQVYGTEQMVTAMASLRARRRRRSS